MPERLTMTKRDWIYVVALAVIVFSQPDKYDWTGIVGYVAAVLAFTVLVIRWAR